MKGARKERLGIAGVCIAGVLILVLGAVLAGCGSSATTTTTVAPATTTSGVPTTVAGGSGGATTQVVLQNIQISPTSVTIKVGDTVTWTNKDGFAHRLVGDKSEFDSGNMAGGATFSFTFKSVGTIAYHCSIHPSMTGTIIVQ